MKEKFMHLKVGEYFLMEPKGTVLHWKISIEHARNLASLKEAQVDPNQSVRLVQFLKELI